MGMDALDGAITVDGPVVPDVTTTEVALWSLTVGLLGADALTAALALTGNVWILTIVAVGALCVAAALTLRRLSLVPQARRRVITVIEQRISSSWWCGLPVDASGIDLDDPHTQLVFAQSGTARFGIPVQVVPTGGRLTIVRADPH
jgi:hypothetical protein